MSILTRAFSRAPTEQRNTYSIADHATAEFLGFGLPNYAGMSVSEKTILGIPAVWSAVTLIAESVAGLPLRTITTGQGSSERAHSFLDNPNGLTDGLTPYEWKSLVITHLAIHGNAFLLHIYGGAGQLVGLQPIHPSAVGVNIADDGTVTYRVSLAGGKTRDFNKRTLTHVPGFSTDGIKGLSPIEVGRNHFSTTLAAEKSAGKMFNHGALMSGIVSPTDEKSGMTDEDAQSLRESLQKKAFGHDNAGGIAVINRSLKFDRWSISNTDLQWLESRAYQTEDVARWFRIPPHLLAQTEKQTSFGVGLTEQNRGLSRYTLTSYTNRLQERLTRLVGPNLKAEFDFTEMLEPDSEKKIELLLKETGRPFLTVNEARAKMNLAPIEDGDVLYDPSKPEGPTVEDNTDE